MAIVGVPLLILWTVEVGQAKHIWGVSIFSVTLTLLYAFSTLYHAVRKPETKELFHVLDHVGIYLLIAGSYTPYLLWFLDGAKGWSFLALIWGIAFVGSFFKLFFTGKFRIVSTIAYVAMGWMIIFFGEPIFANISTESLIWLVAGGLSYTLGVIFFLWKKLRFSHAIWHVFVLAGSVSHFVSLIYAI